MTSQQISRLNTMRYSWRGDALNGSLILVPPVDRFVPVMTVKMGATIGLTVFLVRPVAIGKSSLRRATRFGSLASLIGNTRATATTGKVSQRLACR